MVWIAVCASVNTRTYARMPTTRDISAQDASETAESEKRKSQLTSGEPVSRT